MNPNEIINFIQIDDDDACNADDRYAFLIDYLIDPRDTRYLLSDFDSIHPALTTIADMIDALTPADLRIMLESFELCPIHRCDDAICADDDNPECAHLR